MKCFNAHIISWTKEAVTKHFYMGLVVQSDSDNNFFMLSLFQNITKMLVK